MSTVAVTLLGIIKSLTRGCEEIISCFPSSFSFKIHILFFLFKSQDPIFSSKKLKCYLILKCRLIPEFSFQIHHPDIFWLVVAEHIPGGGLVRKFLLSFTQICLAVTSICVS